MPEPTPAGAAGFRSRGQPWGTRSASGCEVSSESPLNPRQYLPGLLHHPQQQFFAANDVLNQADRLADGERAGIDVTGLPGGDLAFARDKGDDIAETSSPRFHFQDLLDLRVSQGPHLKVDASCIS